MNATTTRCCRLGLERLEGRDVPAAFTAGSVSELVADITAANLTPEADTITLAPSTTFTLTQANNTTDGGNGLPVIADNENLTIVGNNDVIERSTAAGTPRFRLFEVNAGASLTLEDLTLQGGLVSMGHRAGPKSAVIGQGGAILSLGALTLHGVTIRNNVAQGLSAPPLSSTYGVSLPGFPGQGGGIWAGGMLTMNDCIVQNNTAAGGHGGDYGFNGLSFTPGQPGGGAFGGGLYAAGGTITINNTTFAGNAVQGGDGGKGITTAGANGGNGFGGGVYVAGGTVTMHGVSITADTATGGIGGAGGKGKPAGQAGQGIGGGLYIAPTASVGLDAFTLAHVTGNHASTSDNDIHGPYVVIP